MPATALSTAALLFAVPTAKGVVAPGEKKAADGLGEAIKATANDPDATSSMGADLAFAEALASALVLQAPQPVASAPSKSVGGTQAVAATAPSVTASAKAAPFALPVAPAKLATGAILQSPAPAASTVELDAQPQSPRNPPMPATAPTKSKAAAPSTEQAALPVPAQAKAAPSTQAARAAPVAATPPEASGASPILQARAATAKVDGEVRPSRPSAAAVTAPPSNDAEPVAVSSFRATPLAKDSTRPTQSPLIPAKAGIQSFPDSGDHWTALDPRFRGDERSVGVRAALADPAEDAAATTPAKPVETSAAAAVQPSTLVDGKPAVASFETLPAVAPQDDERGGAANDERDWAVKTGRHGEEREARLEPRAIPQPIAFKADPQTALPPRAAPVQTAAIPIVAPAKADEAPTAKPSAAKARSEAPPPATSAPTISKPSAPTAPSQPQKASVDPAPVEAAAPSTARSDTSAEAKPGPAIKSDPDEPAPTPQPPAPLATALASQTQPVVRALPETVSRLATQIVRKLDGKSTRFDVALDPVGLGRVNVRVEIAASGQVTAALSFDNPHAAAELRGRADELRQALQQAGFDVSKAGLSFSEGGQGQAHQNAAQRAPKARAGWASSGEADDGPAAISNSAPRRRDGARGVDVRI